MNFFGRKNNKKARSPSIQFTSGTEAVVSTRPTPPPSIAFVHSHADSGDHQTSTIELGPASSPNNTKSYDQTMQELHDFQIDSDDSDNDGFDDVEFGDTLVTNATAHVEREQHKKRKTATFSVLTALVIVGICVGIVAAVAVGGSNRGASNSSTTDQSLELLVPPFVDTDSSNNNNNIAAITANATSTANETTASYWTDLILEEEQQPFP